MAQASPRLIPARSLLRTSPWLDSALCCAAAGIGRSTRLRRPLARAHPPRLSPRRARPVRFQPVCSYITVDAEAGRSLFYAFVESTHSPRSDPLVLWLNGGPGCSSLGGGFLAELGPFYPTPGGHRLIPNKFAWNT